MQSPSLTTAIRGLPYITSAVGGGGGSPKNRRKEQNQLISVHDKGGGGHKIQFFFADVIYGSPPRKEGRSRNKDKDLARSESEREKGLNFIRDQPASKWLLLRRPQTTG